MALANLAINVTANVGDVTANIGKISTFTADEMRKTASSIGTLQRSVDQTATAIDASADVLGKSMTTAKDIVVQSTAESSRALEAMASTARNIDVGGVGKKVADSMNELDTAKTKVQVFADDVKSYAERTAIFMGAALVTGISAAVFGAAYAAYKSTDFLVGLITGDSYKSENIDALIAYNKAVSSLQTELHMTAVEAGAAYDALNRFGIASGDISTVVSGVSSALSDNTEELDRLGVKYKDANGKVLETRQIVENAKKTLDEYTEGWDRNQAAAAIGMGTYDQINNYLRLNQEELRKSKERVDEYNLGIGPEAQAAIAAYETAMREFHNEQKLMSEGFKRAIADNIMPALTDLAKFFRDGWPVVVRAFRYTMAEVTSLMWGLKMSADIVVDTIKGGFGSITDLLLGIAKAAALALTGDFAGARDALVEGWDKSKTHLSRTWEEIVADAKHNAAAMRLAWGMDDRTDPSAGKAVKGKSFVAAPEKDDGKDANLWVTAQNKYLAYLKAFNAMQAEEIKQAAQYQLEINKEAYDWGLKDLKSYLDTKHSLAEKEIQDEIKLKKEELARYSAEVAKGFEPNDAKSAIRYHEALTKQAEAKKDLIALEGKLKLTRAQNANESKLMTYEEAKQFNDLSVQLLEIKGRYEEAAKARAEFEKKSPDFLKLSPEAQKLKNGISDNAIRDGQIKDADLERQRQMFSADISSGLAGNNPFSEAAQEKQRLEIENNYQQRLLQAEKFYGKDKSLAQKWADEKARIEKLHGMETRNFEKGIWEQRAQTIGNQMGQIGNILMQGNKEQFEAGKAFAIASAIVNTYMAASAAFAGITAETGGWGIALAVTEAAVAVATGMAQVATIASTQYQPRAMGGPVQAGGTYLVGENGPEILRMGAANGYVSSNRELRAAGGDVNVTQVYQIHGDVPEAVEASVRRAAPAIIKASIAAIHADINNGGPLARKLRVA